MSDPEPLLNLCNLILSWNYFIPKRIRNAIFLSQNFIKLATATPQKRLNMVEQSLNRKNNEFQY